ncbi:hypothetical protein L1080_037165 [Rhodococcus sp. MSC1_016]|jgi:hypothetical protein|uniref:hypothetical protein n=1 Tax=Rhodococcus sp. MSC1_016 TaxID=2909266 RepID=UPI00202DD57B|nr:hypothetical protein [Rhodococcus sp. MSC1_016]
MTTKPGFEAAEVLITVKTYPSPSAKYEETVCVAGVRLDQGNPQWIRLYPVRFRNMGEEYQFGKYERVLLDVRKHGSADPRVESFRPNQESIQSLGRIAAKGVWPHRRNLLQNLVGETTTCELIAANKAVKMSEPSPSLGLIQPEILEVIVEPGKPWTREQMAKIDQASQPKLFGETLRPLEPMPYTVRYHYRCATKGCPTHSQKVIDWELGQAGRKWRRESGDLAALEQIREKWESMMCDPSVDLHFYIGNQHQRRHTFSILGTWYPKAEKRSENLVLF